MTNKERIQAYSEELREAIAMAENLPDVGEDVVIELQEKSVTPTTNEQIVTPDSEYDGLSKVTVGAMPTATQATPSISVSSSGLITASATQTAGYVEGGTESATKQLPTQEEKTITPSTSQQTAVAAGTFVTGAVRVAAIPSSYVRPIGTLSIDENGTHDVTNYAAVDVNVPAPEINLQTKMVTPSEVPQLVTPDDGYDGLHKVSVSRIPVEYVIPKGTKDVTENGEYDVTEYAAVNINVPTGVNEDLEAVLAEQEALIAELQDTLRGKAAGSGEIKPDPSKEYQRVDSVTNDGDAYFLTDIIADNSTGAELTASFQTQQDCVPMGSSTSVSNTRFFVPYLLSASTVYYGFNAGTSLTFSSSKNTKYTASINFRNSRTAMLYDANGLAKVGQAVTRSVTQQTAPITILCYKTPSGRGASRKCTLYGARISQGEEVIRDYVPCYRKSDGEVGLYDMCTGTFLPNSGTDPLTKGEDVEW